MLASFVGFHRDVVNFLQIRRNSAENRFVHRFYSALTTLLVCYPALLILFVVMVLWWLWSTTHKFIWLYYGRQSSPSSLHLCWPTIRSACLFVGLCAGRTIFSEQHFAWERMIPDDLKMDRKYTSVSISSVIGTIMLTLTLLEICPLSRLPSYRI